MLGFIAVHSGTPITRNRPSYYGKYRIITQPELSNLMYSIYPYGRVVQFGGNLWNLFIRTDLPILININNIIKKKYQFFVKKIKIKK